MHRTGYYGLLFCFVVISFGLLIGSLSTSWYYSSSEVISTAPGLANCTGSACQHYLKKIENFYIYEIATWTSNQTYGKQVVKNVTSTLLTVHNYTTISNWEAHPLAYKVFEKSIQLATAAIVFTAITLALLIVSFFGRDYLKASDRPITIIIVVLTFLSFALCLTAVCNFGVNFTDSYKQDITVTGKNCTDPLCTGWYGWSSKVVSTKTTNLDYGWTGGWSMVFSAAFVLLLALGVFSYRLWENRKQFQDLSNSPFFGILSSPPPTSR